MSVGILRKFSKQLVLFHLFIEQLRTVGLKNTIPIIGGYKDSFYQF